MVRNLCGQKSGRITAWNRSTEVKKIVFILEWVFLILCLHTVTSSLSLSHALDLSLIKPLPLKIIEVSFSENIICTLEKRKWDTESYISKALTPDNAKMHWMQYFLHHLFLLTVNPRKTLTLDHAPEDCGKMHMGKLSGLWARNMTGGCFLPITSSVQ